MPLTLERPTTDSMQYHTFDSGSEYMSTLQSPREINRTDLMNEHIDRLLERCTVSIYHGEEPEAHSHVEPFAHAATSRRVHVFVCGCRFLLDLCTAPF